MSVADPRASKRSPRQYEEELRRQELAVSRALVQVVPTERRPKTSELRQLHAELVVDIKQLEGRDRPGSGRAPAAGPGRQRQSALDQFEAARDAIDEVLERWERRRDQLSAEIDRRSPRPPVRPPAGTPSRPRPRPRGPGPSRGPRGSNGSRGPRER